MQMTELGRSGLSVSVAGLGCGGNSRLGLGNGKTHAEAVALVRAALDRGVTFLDTAEAYATEEVVGDAIAGIARDTVVVSTKCRLSIGGRNLSAGDVVESLEASLRRMKLDCVDVFHLHAVAPTAYDRALGEIVPTLLKERDKGKIHHLGITETSPNDPDHEMLARAVHDGVFEVMMFAFHMLHQGARQTVFPHTQSNGIGTLLMFVVRNIFSRPGLLAETVRALAAEGRLPDGVDVNDPLGFLVHEGGASSIIDAAYRYARHEPGSNVVLFGTGSIGHLEANIRSILAPPLPASDVTRLNALFDGLSGVGLDLPDRVAR